MMYVTRLSWKIQNWDEINVVLAEWADALTVMSAIDSLRVLRAIVEVIYVMGYNSGKKDKGE